MTPPRRIGLLLLSLILSAPAFAQPLPAGSEPASEPSIELPPEGPEEVTPTASEVPSLAPEVVAQRTTPVAVEPEAPAEPPADPEPPKPASTPWYEKINLRGYTQVRYNRLPSFDENPDLINRQGDRSIGEGNGFLIRRARLILSGDIHDHVSIYLQPDFASWIGDQGHVAILRDWYADLFLDKAKQFRFRVGQSKVPYGFENLQSSSNRLPLDRNDALNSAVKDERDLGVFFYWSPPVMRERFQHLVQSGLKGSGDYGIVGFGVYNGQTANVPAQVDNLHVVGRVSVPFQIGPQYIEIGGGGYYGKYRINLQNREDVTYTVPNGDPLLLDARAFGTFVLYPQPLGFVAEYTVGVGPQQGRVNPTVIDSRRLHGGYAQLMLKIDDPFGTIALIPYVRGTYYNGGKKFMTNAPHYVVKEVELGVEWQIIKPLEIVLAYMIADRTSDAYPYDEERGHVTRVQVQVNY